MYICHRNKQTTYLKTIMEKQKLYIERELKSNSQSIIWNLISTPEGLSRWIADEVLLNGNALTLTWNKADGHRKTVGAQVVGKAKNHYFRFRWDDETEPEAIIELRMERSEITNDHFLCITDYALPDELEQLEDLWEEDFFRLRQNTGLL